MLDAVERRDVRRRAVVHPIDEAGRLSRSRHVVNIELNTLNLRCRRGLYWNFIQIGRLLIEAVVQRNRLLHQHPSPDTPVVAVALHRLWSGGSGIENRSGYRDTDRKSA